MRKERSATTTGVLEGAKDLVIRDGVFTAVGRDQIFNNNAPSGGTPLEKLLAHCAIEATHDSETAAYAPRCKAGTRREILKDMRSWRACGANDRLATLTLLWLSGPAGGGKSCIQRELVEICKEEGVLAASYFFSTRVEKLDSARPFVATLAIQLCGCIPGFKPLVEEEILNDVSLFEKSMEVQFERLISVPLQRISSACPRPAEPITTPYTQPLLSKPQSSSKEAPPNDWNKGRTKSRPEKRSVTSTLGMSALLRLLHRVKPHATKEKAPQPVDSAKVTADLLSQIDKINCHPPHADSGFATFASKPTNQSSKTITRKVIIIDGLDECRNAKDRVRIIRLLASALANATFPFRIAIASRPEFDIRSTFEDNGIRATTYRIKLEDYRDGSDTDIESFLIDTIFEIRMKHPSSASIPCDWPSRKDIQKVVGKSSGQFIYASTFLTFIDNPRRNLVEMFDLAVNFLQTSSTTVNPFTTLDALYTCILDAADVDISLLKRLLHGVITMNALGEKKTKITTTLLDEFFGLTPGTTATAFCDLHSLIHIIPLKKPQQSLIRFHHKSLEDYLLDPLRSGQYHRAPLVSNKEILGFCINHLSPWAELARTYRKVTSHPPLATEYASRHWLAYAKSLFINGGVDFLTTDALVSLPMATMIYRHLYPSPMPSIGECALFRDQLHAELCFTIKPNDCVPLCKELYRVCDVARSLAIYDSNFLAISTKDYIGRYLDAAQ
ncbi:hypothetical protein FA15DRAFT_671115 [Coprinopsis marcescibilis]|uniref:Nephrocystin 3-like N-terminal domain-containing protein n=1 Tax=Coprinopsis marcescibilis TaxID=230819 RepID=A0A5C3KRI2_COPMA|nr:hypothetical protein FA15DRAFT_671115 [Coprinopsis marcescibilis]